MRKSIIGLVTFVFFATFGFSAPTCLAEELQLDMAAKAEIAKIFDVMWKNFGGRFSYENFSNYDFVRFGIINSGYTPKNGSKMLPAKYVEAAVSKYFNIKVKHESIEGFPYKNGYYHEYAGPDTDFGPYYHAKITRVEKIGDQAIKVSANRFEDSSSQVLRVEAAVMRKVTINGKVRYIPLVVNSVQP